MCFTNVNEAGIRYRYFMYSTNKCTDFNKNITLYIKKKKKKKKKKNKTLLLIKQYITYMNISRYANMDKFVNIRHIFLLARRAYS